MEPQRLRDPPLTSKVWVGSGGGDGFLFMVTGSRIPSLWDPCRAEPDIPIVPRKNRGGAPISLSEEEARKKKKRACSFRRSAQCFAAGTDCFHATGLITNVFQQAASQHAGVRGAEQQNPLKSEAPRTSEPSKRPFRPLGPLPHQVPFSKVFVGLFLTAGGFFFQAAINCNFTHRDKEPLRKQTNRGYGRRRET